MSFEQRITGVLFTVCVLSFCGCMSLEDGPETPSTVVVVVPGVTERPQPSATLLFAWDSATLPIINNIYANSIVPSGFGDIFFGTYGNSHIPEAGGAIGLSPNRTLLIGPTQETLAGDTGTGAAPNIVTVHRPGQFDFSQGTFRITLDYRNYNPQQNDPWMRILLNNNVGGDGRSVLGVDSRLCHFRDTLDAGDSSTGVTYQGGRSRVVLTFTPSVRYANANAAAKDSLKTAFIGIRCNNTSVNITGIKLEKVE